MTIQAFNQLKDLENKMQMQHIYQPVMIRRILKNQGRASIREIAQDFLNRDRSQLEYYEQITTQVPGRVLSRRGIVERIGGDYNLTSAVRDLTEDERNELINLCDKKLQAFLAKQQSDPWQHRRKAGDYVPGSTRYQVLKNAGGRCEACGVSVEQKALEVDHIIPRNKGGSNDSSNFQALCYTCNSQKRDLDDTDFHAMKKSYGIRERNCAFCSIESGRVVDSNELALAVRDKYPVTPFHTLIIPKRHVSSMFELHQSELNAVHQLLRKTQSEIRSSDNTVEGFNVGVNVGDTAGQTIFHCHIHLIPRRPSDVEKPRGGVRGVIPGKQSY